MSNHYVHLSQEVQKNFSNNIIIRPSIVVGPRDKFFNMFAKLAGLLPLIPLVGADVKFQPICVTDIAEAINQIIKRKITQGIYELAGKKVYSFKELIELLLKEIRKTSKLINVIHAKYVVEITNAKTEKVIKYTVNDL